MFDLFKGEGGTVIPGLQRMRTEFGQMLDSGRHMFDAAANAFLGGTDLAVIRDELFATDKRINRAERQIRREIVVHASVHGAAEFPPCLVLMSVVKDAERVGDYGKNLFDLAELALHAPSGEHRECLVGLKDRISSLMAACRGIFDSGRQREAIELIVKARELEDVCDEKIRQLIRQPGGADMAPAYVLAYRYFKRVVSHVRNITSSVVQPLDELDFTPEIALAEKPEAAGEGATNE